MLYINLKYDLIKTFFSLFGLNNIKFNILIEKVSKLRVLHHS